MDEEIKKSVAKLFLEKKMDQYREFLLTALILSIVVGILGNLMASLIYDIFLKDYSPWIKVASLAVPSGGLLGIYIIFFTRFGQKILSKQNERIAAEVTRELPQDWLGSRKIEIINQIKKGISESFKDNNSENMRAIPEVGEVGVVMEDTGGVN